MYKVIWLAKFRPDLPREDVLKWWRGPHAELAKAAPGMLRYVQSYWVEALDGTTQLPTGEPPFYDGHAEHWFESLEAYKACMASPEWKLTLEDGPNASRVAVGGNEKPSQLGSDGNGRTPMTTSRRGWRALEKCCNGRMIVVFRIEPSIADARHVMPSRKGAVLMSLGGALREHRVHTREGDSLRVWLGAQRPAILPPSHSTRRALGVDEPTSISSSSTSTTLRREKLKPLVRSFRSSPHARPDERR